MERYQIKTGSEWMEVWGRVLVTGWLEFEMPDKDGPVKGLARPGRWRIAEKSKNNQKEE